MILNPSIEVHTSPVERPSVPPWFAEVVIMAQHLATKGAWVLAVDRVPVADIAGRRVHIAHCLAHCFGLGSNPTHLLASPQ